MIPLRLGAGKEAGVAGREELLSAGWALADMPFHWKIDSAQRYVEVQAEGPVTVQECLDMFRAFADVKCLDYRKLYDVRKAVAAFTAEDIMTVAVAVREYHQQARMGPLAIVATSEQTVRFRQLLGALAVADRAMRLCATVGKARRWLASLD